MNEPVNPQTIRDPYFRVDLLACTPAPASVIWSAAHNDYSEGYIQDEWQAGLWPDEDRAADLILKHLLHSHRPHSGPLEHATITLSTSGFPHNVMVQHRTHRVPWTFDVQSQRYTGERVCQVALGERPIEEVFYFRPLGYYHDRSGNKYHYDAASLGADRQLTQTCAEHYAKRLAAGYAPEHARDMLPQNIRQNYIFSTNLRGLLHFFNMRSARDAQLEIQSLCEYMWPHFEAWVPALAAWYRSKYWGRSPLTF